MFISIKYIYKNYANKYIVNTNKCVIVKSIIIIEKQSLLSNPYFTQRTFTALYLPYYIKIAWSI